MLGGHVFFIKVSDIIEFVPVWAGGQLRRKFVCCFHGISVASALLESVHSLRTRPDLQNFHKVNAKNFPWATKRTGHKKLASRTKGAERTMHVILDWNLINIHIFVPLFRGGFFRFLSIFIQQCFICHPSDSKVSEDAWTLTHAELLWLFDISSQAL
jgi:hypothetical protein